MNAGPCLRSCILSALLAVAVLTACSSSKNADRPKDAQTSKSVEDTREIQGVQVLTADQIPYRPEVAAVRLNVPWALDMAADGRIFITERPGTIRVIENGRLLAEPVFSVPSPFAAEGEGGLLGLTLDPNFANNHYLYIYHTYKEQGEIRNRVLRLIERGNRASVDKVLLTGIPGHVIHNGGRLKIGPDNRLYITTGDVGVPANAQDLNSLAGKILRIGLDGSIPPDNPFPGSPVYSWGHRNPQGLAWQQGSQHLYSFEHGQSAHDELNKIDPGANYGWPLMQGDEQLSDKDMRRPVLHSGSRTWAPAGMVFVRNGPWKGQILAANLRGQQVLKIRFTESGTVSLSGEVLYPEQFGRLRDILEGPDGSLYLLTSNRDGRGRPEETDDRLIRLRPIF